MTIALSEQADEISLTVTDDGPGVPPEYQERIFERFTRVEDARTRNDGGTGLGLAIARDIISDHGGTIRYDGKYKPGARFVIELPVNR